MPTFSLPALGLSIAAVGLTALVLMSTNFSSSLRTQVINPAGPTVPTALPTVIIPTMTPPTIPSFPPVAPTPGLPACSDNIDNDGDGKVDCNDPGCGFFSCNPQDNGEQDQDHGVGTPTPMPSISVLPDPFSSVLPSPFYTPTPGPTKPICDDGIDNDGDGSSDAYQPDKPDRRENFDQGCSSPTDSDERNSAVACDDGKDNDGDGRIDHIQSSFGGDVNNNDDPGCINSVDTSEISGRGYFNSGLVYNCDDGTDNDGDGKVDYRVNGSGDQDCRGPELNDELPDACFDKKDNDSDGKIDYPSDPGCTDRTDSSESDPPQCSDGKDNDGDGKIDYKTDGTGDPQCVSDTGLSEKPTYECSDGKDNDKDFLADRDDAGCHSDGQATNTRSYVATDKDESDDNQVKVDLHFSGPAITGPDNVLFVEHGGAVNADVIWISYLATSCFASGDWSGRKEVDGLEEIAFSNIRQEKTLTITCYGNYPGDRGSATGTVKIKIKPTITFTADDTKVAYNKGTMLRWKATHATKCVAKGPADWRDSSKIVAGSEGVTGITSTRTYTLECSNAAGGKASKSVTVRAAPAPPTLTLQANKENGAVVVSYNKAATLSWTSKNSEKCEGKKGTSPWQRSQPTSDTSWSTGKLTKTTTFELTCKGDGGSVTDTVKVNVLPEFNRS